MRLSPITKMKGKRKAATHRGSRKQHMIPVRKDVWDALNLIGRALDEPPGVVLRRLLKVTL